MSKAKLELYAVMSEDGQFLRSQGYSGRNGSWVDNLESAKIYPKIGSARARVTYFANHYPSYEPPKIVKLSVTKVELLDDAEHLREKKAKEKGLKRRLLKIRREEPKKKSLI